jgi:hypothetical protein
LHSHQNFSSYSKVFAQYWSERLFNANTTFISSVTSASSISVGSSFPYDHIILPFCARVDQDIRILNSELLSANFRRVTRIDGSLSLINNKMLANVVLSALTVIVGQLLFTSNPQLLPLALTVSVGRCIFASLSRLRI